MASIELAGVQVDYPIYSARSRSLRTHILRTVGGDVRRFDQHEVRIRALEEMTLTIRSGERVALLGGNGAGKSTLLRVLAGIMEPPIGSVKIAGSVSALLDMSMGMDSEATGYENIVMRSVFLGATFEEARARTSQIEEFSGLGEYLEFPLRTYSSGMIVRLSFAIATSIVPEILVLDEHVGAADAAFAAKATARILELAEKVKIVVFATHSMAQARLLCTRGILMNRGRISCDGPLEQAIAEYEKSLAQPAA